MSKPLLTDVLAPSAADTVPESSSPDDPSQQEFKEAPDFKLETLKGATFTLSELNDQGLPKYKHDAL